MSPYELFAVGGMIDYFDQRHPGTSVGDPAVLARSVWPTLSPSDVELSPHDSGHRELFKMYPLSRGADGAVDNLREPSHLQPSL
jgi:hypothetical protein